MFSKIRPSRGVAIGVVLTCALGLVARYVADPLPSESSTAPTTSHMSAHTPSPYIEADAPFTAEPVLPSIPSPTPPGTVVDRGILLARDCLTLAERDPLAAMDMAAANQLHEVDPGLAASLMTQWAAKDFARAYEWTKAQEPGAWRDDILARLAFVRVKSNPVAAATLAVTDISAGRTRDEAVISVVHQWALQDQRSASRWVQAFPDETLRLRASAEIAGGAASSSQSNGTH